MNQSFFGLSGKKSQSLQLSLKYKAAYLGHMPKGSLPKTYKKRLKIFQYHRCFHWRYFCITDVSFSKMLYTTETEIKIIKISCLYQWHEGNCSYFQNLTIFFNFVSFALKYILEFWLLNIPLTNSPWSFSFIYVFIGQI